MAGLAADFGASTPGSEDAFAEHYEMVRANVPEGRELSRSRQLLLGACFTMEYALESVALFNPSIVPALSQDGVPPGSVRFVMSLRATGEGHVSSIIFRVGILDEQGNIELEPPGAHGRPLKASVPDEFEKTLFQRDLAALGVTDGRVSRILDRLGPRFTRDDLSTAIDRPGATKETSGFLEEAADSLIAATQANYRLDLPEPPLSRESEIVIFPFSDIERHGIEDLRLVLFTDDDGTRTYYGTFTAYNGVRVFPQLLEYRGRADDRRAPGDGRNGPEQGHGAVSAADQREVRDDLADRQREPVLHGVGGCRRLGRGPAAPGAAVPLAGGADRQLRISARDRGGLAPHDSRRRPDAAVLHRGHPAGSCRAVAGSSAQTREPLLVPTAEWRSSGYVPNVVYSCGAMIHNRKLIIPYAISDLTTSAVRVDLDELLDSIRS